MEFCIGPAASIVPLPVKPLAVLAGCGLCWILGGSLFDKLQKAEKFTGQRWKPRGQGAMRVKRTRLAVSASKREVTGVPAWAGFGSVPDPHMYT